MKLLNAAKKIIQDFKICRNFEKFNADNYVNFIPNYCDTEIKYRILDFRKEGNLKYFLAPETDKDYGGISEQSHKYCEEEDSLKVNFKIKSDNNKTLILKNYCALLYPFYFPFKVDNFDILRIKIKGNNKLGICITDKNVSSLDFFNVAYINLNDNTEYQIYDYPINKFKGNRSGSVFKIKYDVVTEIGFFREDPKSTSVDFCVKYIDLVKVNNEYKKYLETNFVFNEFKLLSEIEKEINIKKEVTNKKKENINFNIVNKLNK